MVYNFFGKKTSGSGSKNENMSNKKLELVFYYVLLIFSVNTHGLFLSKIKHVSQLLILSKNLR